MDAQFLVNHRGARRSQACTDAGSRRTAAPVTQTAEEGWR